MVKLNAIKSKKLGKSKKSGKEKEVKKPLSEKKAGKFQKGMGRSRKEKKVNEPGGSTAKSEERVNIKSIGTRIMAVMVIPLIILVILIIMALNSIGATVSSRMAEQELKVAENMYYQNIDSSTYGGYAVEDGKLFKGSLEMSYKQKDFDTLYEMTGVSIAFLTKGDAATICASGIEGVELKESLKERLFAADAVPVYDSSYDINGEEYYAYIAPLFDDNETEVVACLMSAIPKGEIKSIYKTKSISTSIFFVVIIFIAVIVMVIVVRTIIRGLKAVAGNLAQLESGQLNFEISKKLVSRNDEVGKIAKALHKVVQSFAQTVLGIHKSMNELDDFSNEFVQKFDNIGDFMESINVAVNEISEGSAQQAADTQSVGEGISSMNKAVGRTTESIGELSESASVMEESNRTVEATLKELMEISERTAESVDEVQKQTNLTNASVQEIYTATDLIAGIAKKTNLLSMNASIEAARAGEMGRGFAVVAEEIRGLADQSKESTDTIRGIVQTLIDNSNQSVSIMDGVVDGIKLQGEKLEMTGSVFENLNVEVQKVVKAIEDISVEISNIKTVSENVISNVDGLASVSANNAEGTQKTVETMEQLNQIVSDCRNTTKELQRISRELVDNADKFKI